MAAAARQRRIVIQSLFMRIRGSATRPAEQEAYCERLGEIVAAGGKIKLVQVHTVARPPAESWVSPLSNAEVDALVDVIRQRTGLPVAAFYGRSTAPTALSPMVESGYWLTNTTQIEACPNFRRPIMSDPYFQKLFAQRIGGAEYGKGSDIYKFEKIKRAKRKAMAEHPERKLIDFGIGENDEMAAAAVRRFMAEAINDPKNRGYADNGIAEYQRGRRPADGPRIRGRARSGHRSEPLHRHEDRPGDAAGGFIDPGDVTLMTVPGYPVAGTHTKYYGGEVHRLPLLAENDFFPDLDSIPADIFRRAKLLVMNYPNSPTGPRGYARILRRVIDFAQRHRWWWSRTPPTSCSATAAAAELPASAGGEGGGRRSPFDVEGLAHDRLADGLGLRQRADRAGVCRRQGQLRLRPVHRHAKGGRRGARRPRDSPPRCARNTTAGCASWSTCSAAAASSAACPAERYFLYTPAPRACGGPSFETAEAASQYLITEHSICTVPWDDAGPYLRLSVTYEADDEAAEDQLMAETERRLQSIGLTF